MRQSYMGAMDNGVPTVIETGGREGREFGGNGMTCLVIIVLLIIFLLFFKDSSKDHAMLYANNNNVGAESSSTLATIRGFSEINSHQELKAGNALILQNQATNEVNNLRDENQKQATQIVMLQERTYADAKFNEVFKMVDGLNQKIDLSICQASNYFKDARYDNALAYNSLRSEGRFEFNQLQRELDTKPSFGTPTAVTCNPCDINDIVGNRGNNCNSGRRL